MQVARLKSGKRSEKLPPANWKKYQPEMARLLLSFNVLTQQESGIKAGLEDLNYRGHIFFEFENDSKILDVHVFIADKWSGHPVETDEVHFPFPFAAPY